MVPPHRQKLRTVRRDHILAAQHANYFIRLSVADDGQFLESAPGKSADRAGQVHVECQA